MFLTFYRCWSIGNGRLPDDPDGNGLDGDNDMFSSVYVYMYKGERERMKEFWGARAVFSVISFESRIEKIRRRAMKTGEETMNDRARVQVKYRRPAAAEK